MTSFYRCELTLNKSFTIFDNVHCDSNRIEMPGFKRKLKLHCDLNFASKFVNFAFINFQLNYYSLLLIILFLNITRVIQTSSDVVTTLMKNSLQISVTIKQDKSKKNLRFLSNTSSIIHEIR